MSLSQAKKVVPPISSDPGLVDYSNTIQGNLNTLYQAGHTHQIVNAIPSSGDGNPGDIFIVVLTTGTHLYAKTTQTTWVEV